jgi:hypothetical protein
MKSSIPLYELAHCRAGDKGNDSLLVLTPYASSDFERLRHAVTPQILAHHFAVPTPERVSVTPMPSVGALVITIRDLLAGGVTRANGADPHGKTLSSHLLELRIPRSAEPVETRPSKVRPIATTARQHARESPKGSNA